MEAVTTQVDELPGNGRENLAVVQETRHKTPVQGVDETLASGRKDVDLDATHRALMDALEESGYSTLWNQDDKRLQTNTTALAAIFASQIVPIKGVFSTHCNGLNPDEPNCYMLPLDGGGWRVYRFGVGAVETDLWQTDDQGRTFCFYDCQPTLRTAALAHGGVEDPRNGQFVFPSGRDVQSVMTAIGAHIDLPADFDDREMSLGRMKDGRISISINKAEGDEHPAGYVDAKSKWMRVLNVQVTEPDDETEDYRYDGTIRRLISVDGTSAGWMLRSTGGQWIDLPKDDVKDVLISLGVDKKDVDGVVGKFILWPWRLANLPFQGEYPGGRQWNHRAAQLVYEPIPAGQEPTHPTWDLILKHCGRDLDDPLAKLPWAREDCIYTGADYLLTWIAMVLRQPLTHLPYLFFYGEENSGKSIFHEAISLLITAGYVKADKALTSRSDFNGELAGAILAVVEEKDISKTPGAHAKIKEWVTGEQIAIRRMHTDSYMVPNLTHWVQCANTWTACPIFAGDTRITVMHVGRPDRDIPKHELKERLRDEAPHFMRTIADLPLPAARGRLGIPPVESKSKRAAIDARDPLSAFFRENVVSSPGQYLPFRDFIDKFHATLIPAQVAMYSDKCVGTWLGNAGIFTKQRGKGRTIHLVDRDWSTAS